MVIEISKDDKQGESANLDVSVQTSNAARSVKETTGLQ